MQLDLEKFNTQYEPIEVVEFIKSHDRFLILDETEVYPIGASLKDLNQKTVCFLKIEYRPQRITREIVSKRLIS